MELYEDRILVGLVKSVGVRTLEKAGDLLARDIEIVASPDRAIQNDLWPCIWALCASLERQFSGTIHIRCGLKGPLKQPAALSSRCSFGTASSGTPIRIMLGTPSTGEEALHGDTRGKEIGYGRAIDRPELAHPIGCFALAGYLAFAALATAVEIPPFRAEYCSQRLVLPLRDLAASLPEAITLVGIGQLGQAYLALLYFLGLRTGQRPRLALIDKDFFERPNQRTQLLLDQTDAWLAREKAIYCTELAQSWGWKVRGELTEISWAWKRSPEHAPIVLLGLDDLEIRRMAVAGGFEWIVEAGLSTSFAEPRFSWHSFRADNRLAKALFPASRVEESPSLQAQEGNELHQQLLTTPGQCGWVTFKNIKAAAPSMGLAGAAFAIAELLNGRDPVCGRACLWSPLLPFQREPLIAGLPL